MTGALKIAVDGPVIRVLVVRKPAMAIDYSDHSNDYWVQDEHLDEPSPARRQWLQRKMPEQFGLNGALIQAAGSQKPPTWFVTWVTRKAVSCASKHCWGRCFTWSSRDRTRVSGHDRFCKMPWFCSSDVLLEENEDSLARPFT